MSLSQRTEIDLSQPMPLETFADPLTAAVVLSFFCNARALPEDNVKASQHGWWGDEFADTAGDRWGSRLWILMQRGKLTNETLRLAEAYAEESLQWMLSDALVDEIDVTASVPAADTLLLTVKLDETTLMLEVES